MRALLHLTIILMLGTWSLAQTAPPQLPHTVLDRACCAYPRLRFAQQAMTTADALPGNRMSYYYDLRLLVLTLNQLERSPRPAAQQLNNVRTALWNLGQALGGRYDIRPWYQEMQAHRRRLPASEESAYLTDSIRSDTLDRIVDSLAAVERAQVSYAHARRREREAALRARGDVKLWGWMCGPDGRTVHYHRECPAWLFCTREPVNIELERIGVEKRELCGWCVVYGWPATTPCGRDE
jgi:hypothetical protein